MRTKVPNKVGQKMSKLVLFLLDVHKFEGYAVMVLIALPVVCLLLSLAVAALLPGLHSFSAAMDLATMQLPKP